MTKRTCGNRLDVSEENMRRNIKVATLINNFDYNKRYKRIIKEGVRGVLSIFYNFTTSYNISYV